ncbi:MAG: IS1182 family transposase [Treponema sp.]|nr:IS1182 family transposase [Treponema sp.]
MILFPESIEEYVSEDNTVRVIDAYVDSLDVDVLGFTKAQPKDTGRPPYSPQDLLKLYVYGYMNRVRSSRRLETESKRNIEVMWLLKKLSPDHKTISRFRHENAEALKNVFRDFVKLCMKLNLYGKELVAIDGSKFKAVNSKDRNFTEGKLTDRLARIEAKIAEYLEQLNEQDIQDDGADMKPTAEELAVIISGLSQRKSEYEGYRKDMEESEATQKSLTDPESRLMKYHGDTVVGYNVQTAVDSLNKLIVEFEVTNQAQDKNLLSPMAISAKEMLEAEELSAVSDAGDSASDIVNCIENGITPHVAHIDGGDIQVCVETEEAEIVPIESHTNGRCVYIAKRNVAVCPMGQILYPGSYKKRARAALFRNGRACSKCLCKCTKEKYKAFEIMMKKSEFSKEYDDTNLRVKQITISSDKAILKQRKCIAEHPFGTVKRAMDAGYLLTKGKRKVRGELSLAFLAYNLKRAVNIIGAKQLISAASAR